MKDGKEMEAPEVKKNVRFHLNTQTIICFLRQSVREDIIPCAIFHCFIFIHTPSPPQSVNRFQDAIERLPGGIISNCPDLLRIDVDFTAVNTVAGTVNTASIVAHVDDVIVDDLMVANCCRIVPNAS